MKAWLLDSLGSIQNLRLDDWPDPQPAPGEAVLAVDYAALNPADRYLAQGQYPARPPLPHILGRDGIGTVLSVGAGINDLKPGDRRVLLRGEVGVNRAGTFAQRAAAPVESLVPVPPGWTDQQAAGATLVYLMAYQALTQWGPLPAPSVVLVTGASGGVGVATTQLASAMGHTVIALSRSGEKQRRLRELGAALTLDPNDTQWRRAVKHFLGDRRIDLAVDNVAGRLLPDVIDVLGYDGKVSAVGALAGPLPQFNTATLFFRRIKVGGVAVGTYTNAQSRAAWAAVLELMGRTGATPLVDGVFPLDQLPAAFARLEEGPMGKVILRIGGA